MTAPACRYCGVAGVLGQTLRGSSLALLRCLDDVACELRTELRDLRAGVLEVAERMHVDASGTVDVVEAPVVRAHAAALRNACGVAR